ncbi:MAG: hypothetical protein K2Y37_03385 [Pirellulales bacterium]|nr:hypothetical protein [Pirellulales bacterium]
MRIFLAGIMQGSHLGAVLHNQQYRQQLRELLQRHLPQAEIYDPLSDHANSLDYDERRGREVFFHHAQLAAEVDLVVAVVPEATMGTAIEMWQAYQAGRAVLSISPLVHNWAVRFLSHEVYADLEEFERALADGRVARRLREILGPDRTTARRL